MEYNGIYEDLMMKQPALFQTLFDSCHMIPSIKEAAALLNFNYENKDPEAVQVRAKSF